MPNFKNLRSSVKSPPPGSNRSVLTYLLPYHILVNNSYKFANPEKHIFLKIAKSGLFVYFSFFTHDNYRSNLTINEISVDGVFGT